MTTDFGIDNVREAILKQAVADYIKAYCGTPVGQVDTKVTLDEVKKFFYSPWFGTITDEKIDPDAAFNACKQRAVYAKWRKAHKCVKCKNKECVHRSGDNYYARRICEKGVKCLK